MRIDVHHHFDNEREPVWFIALKSHITATGAKIMTTVVEAVNAASASLNAALDNISGDIDQLQAEIATLTEAVANAPVSAEVQAALDAVVARASSLADRVQPSA